MSTPGTIVAVGCSLTSACRSSRSTQPSTASCGVALRRTEQKLGASRRRIAGGAAAAAAAIALAVLIPSGGGSAHSVATAAARPPAGPSASLEASAAQPLQSARPVEPAVSSSEATIYDLNPGAGREEPRVVWIVDRGLDI